MGFLLKEVLKTLCNRNQWSYAVFWKIGCNNSKLLIWEECYHEPLLCPSPRGIVGMSNLPNQNGEGCWFSSESQSFHLGIREEDKVSSLINKMTVNNLVIVAGEGMIGRAAFTNSHQWILLNNFAKDAYPPEVYAEVHHQFSAGMQTVAVIPVLPHGVVQLGSFLPIMENMGFVHEVKSLILQLGCIPGALLSEDYSEKLSNERLTKPATSGVSMPVDSLVVTSNCTPSIINVANRQSYASHASKPNIQTLCPLREKISKCQGSEWTPQTYNLNEISNKLFQEDRVVEAEVIPSNFHSSLQQHSGAYNARSEFNNLSSGSTSLLRGIPVHGGMNNILGTNLITSSKSPKVSATNLSGAQVGNELQNDNSTNAACHSRANLASRSGAYDLLQAPNIPSFNVEDHIPGFVHDCFHEDSTNQSAMTMGSEHKEACAQPPSGDDLFDILGVDFKNKLLEGHWNELFADESNADVENKVKKEICMNVEGTNSDYYSVDESMLDSGIFSGMSTDHLLDAVVSKAKPSLKQSSDDMSCRTTLTVNSTSSIPSPVSRPIMAGNFEGGLFDFSKYRGKKVAVETSSLRSGCSKDDAGNCSQTTTICGSRLSSWLENGGNVKHENSVSTGYSKRPDEACKSNRKRLKPGENPRPRPKDRQMIQDRVKELREIVPNGAKCSIDALLERTIKHMLFLQSVTKHADKLKQTGESKIISKEGGLLLKDNFEGGATWAYEVGSQSMVCPIIVEDLDPPRQMLVEMLCEERGFFLEIADLIRGLGLTILKGVMEAHNGKIWARFVVEANRDVTRMEIFMSLVRLLEQTMKGNASSSIAIDNMIGYNSLPQNPTQIAATGRPNSMK